MNNNPLMAGTYVQQNLDQTAKLQQQLNDKLVQSVSAFQRGKDAADEWAQLQSGPVSAAIDKVKTNISDLEARIAKLQPTVKPEDNEQFFELNSQLATQKRHLQELESEQTKLNRAEDRAGRLAFNREITALLREQGTTLQNIHEQEQLIKETPLLGIDEKNAAMLALYNREMGVLAAQIQATKAAMQNSALDPAQMEQLRQKLQQLEFEFQHLGLKMVGLQKPFQASMVEWANSFGSVGEQAAKTLQQSIGASLQSLNQMLITGKFNAQSLVQQLANIGLQLIENLAIQQVMALFAKTQQASQRAEAAQSLAVQAPLAAATSISSYGTAAIAATAAIGVIAAIIAALTLHEGGAVPRRRRMHGGGLAADEVPVIAQEGEIMIQRSVAQQPGMAEFLLALNAGMLFHGGGRIRRMHKGGESAFDPDRDDPRDFGGTPAWFTSPTGQGPEGNFPPDWTDPSIEPPALREPDFGKPSTEARGSDKGGGRRESFEQGWDPGTANPWITGFSLVGPGYTPPLGTPGFWQGPTIIPTFFDQMGFPFAVPVAPMPVQDVQPILTGGLAIESHHTGGMIGRARFPRMHSGGSLGSSSAMRSLGGGAGAQVHVYPVMDRRAIIKDMASREGQKLIFDVVRGRRIDLGV
jgi:hypothetical protein